MGDIRTHWGNIRGYIGVIFERTPYFKSVNTMVRVQVALIPKCCPFYVHPHKFSCSSTLTSASTL